MLRGAWRAGVLGGLTALLAGCTGLPWDREDGGTSSAAAWQVLHQSEDVGGPILAVWGWDASHLIMVGGSVGNGGESLVYRYDGANLQRLHPGGTQTYWWTHGTGPNDVWMVGERGRITHFDGTTFRDDPVVVDTTLWGVMAFAPNDVWAVGGTTGRMDPMFPHDLVLHFDGTSWTRETLPGAPRNVALLKTWGTSANDLYVVGEAGTLWHRTATGWTAELDGITPRLANGTLFSVHGCGTDDVYAAGGTTLLHRSNGAWARLPVIEGGFGNAVGCTAAQKALVIGFGGMKLRVDATAPSATEDTLLPPFADLHGVWTAPDGTVWVTGGDWLSQASPGAPREGVVARYGVGKVSSSLVP
jgi:hypothetical protein